jgi:hypothetical protein
MSEETIAALEPPKSEPTEPQLPTTSTKATDFVSKPPTINKKGKEIEENTPSPPLTRYMSDSPSANQTPSQALKWWRDIPQWARDRCIAYVYRDWPILKILDFGQKKDLRDKGLEADDNYIDKVTEPFNHVMDLFDRYGSGDYHLVISDVVHDKRILCTVWIRENWRDFRDHPPTDRRIDKVENLAMEEKGNAAYLAYLRSKGKLPDPIKQEAVREANMADAAVATSATGILGQVVNRVLDEKSNGKEGYASVIGEVLDVMKENMPKQEDPIDNATKMFQLFKTMMPESKESGSHDSTLLGLLITSISDNAKNTMAMQAENTKTVMAMQAENAKMLMSMQAERLNDMREIIASLKPAASEGEDKTAGSSGTSVKTFLAEFVETAGVLGFSKKGVVTEAASGAFDWKAQLPEILDSGGKILGTIVRAWEIKSMLDARAANPNAPIIVQAPQPQLQPQAQPVPATSEPVTENGAEGEGPDQFMLQMLVQGFLNHFKNGWGGDTFAEWLIAGTDQATYENLKSQGPQALTLMLNQIPVTAQEITGKEALLTQFIDEFMRAAEIRAAQDAEDEEGEGEGEGEGEPPEEIPVPAVNGPAKVVRTVKPKAVG